MIIIIHVIMDICYICGIYYYFSYMHATCALSRYKCNKIELNLMAQKKSCCSVRFTLRHINHTIIFTKVVMSINTSFLCYRIGVREILTDSACLNLFINGIYSVNNAKKICHSITSARI